eukprot:3072922-Amphidinium_carterae.1
MASHSLQPMSLMAKWHTSAIETTVTRPKTKAIWPPLRKPQQEITKLQPEEQEKGKSWSPAARAAGDYTMERINATLLRPGILKATNAIVLGATPFVARHVILSCSRGASKRVQRSALGCFDSLGHSPSGYLTQSNMALDSSYLHSWNSFTYRQIKPTQATQSKWIFLLKPCCVHELHDLLRLLRTTQQQPCQATHDVNDEHVPKFKHQYGNRGCN